MSIVSLLGIKVLNNPAKFTDPYEFEITFECLEQLKDDLEWKLTYVGSSRSLEHDQELDSLLVGPVPVGINKFILTADAPSPELIPASELVSVTVILLSCSYKEREFVRVGYYVNNEYDSEELRENPPAKVQVDHIVRNILAEKPRVTRFNIAWDNEGEIDEYPPEQNDDEGDIDDDDVIDIEAEDELEDEEEEEEENDGVKTNLSSDAESAKRQNTLNDDDIPEIKKRKIEETDPDAEDKEEDLDELEEEDEEELEEEVEEDIDDEEVEEEDVEETVEDAEETRVEENNKGAKEESDEVEDDTEIAETPKIESSASTPTEK